MAVKLLGKSKAGNMIKIEDTTNPKGYVWYFLASNVINFAKTIPDNSMVEIKTEERDGQDTITYITKEGGVKPSSNGGVTSTTETKKTYGKSPEEQESIKRMSVLATAAHSVSRCMQGQLDAETLISTIETVYDRLYAKISN